MQKTVVKYAKYSALALAVALASGCANTDTAKMIDENQKAAAQANDTANQALSTAKEALRKADAAAAAARSAQECCDRNSRADKKRFEKEMNK